MNRNILYLNGKWNRLSSDDQIKEIKNNYLKIGEHCSMTERRAEESTRDMIRWLKCIFFSKSIVFFKKTVYKIVNHPG